VLAISWAPTTPASAVVVCPTVTAGVVSPAPSPGVDWSLCNLTGAQLAGADLHGAVLRGTTLNAADLQSANVSGVDLTSARLRSALLGHSTLTGARLTSSDATGASFDGADLTDVVGSNATLVSTSMIGTTLTGATLATSVMRGLRSSGVVVGATAPTLPTKWGIRAGALVGPYATLAGVDLHGQDLSGLSLAYASVTNATLAGAILTNVSLGGARLNVVDLDGTDLSTALMTGLRASGVSGVPTLPTGWTVTQGYLVGPGANLSDARLDDVDLHGRDLSGVTLARAQLHRVDLSGATLAASTLDAAVINDSSVAGATLTPATATGLSTSGLLGTPAAMATGWRLVRGVVLGPYVRLWSVDMSGASLAGIDLTGADIQDGSWSRVDLTGAHLAGASVVNVAMTHSVLTGADLTGAYLSIVELDASVLRNTTLTSVYWYGVGLTYADLRGSVGLGTGNSTNIGWGLTWCPDGTMSEVHNGSSCVAPRDVTPPAVSVGRWAPYQTGVANVAIPLTVRTADAGTGVAVMESRDRTALAGTNRFSPWSDSVWHDPSDRSVLDGGTSDARTCVEVRARDGAGNWSAWSAERCSTWLTDDIDMMWSPQWRRTDRPGWFNGTFAHTTARGASLTTSTSRAVRTLGLAARTCPTCGSVALYVGSHKIRSISLARATTGRVVVVLPRFTKAISGKVRLVVTSTGRLVVIDGILISST